MNALVGDAGGGVAGGRHRRRSARSACSKTTTEMFHNDAKPDTGV
jgi:hypothetical protein